MAVLRDSVELAESEGLNRETGDQRNNTRTTHPTTTNTAAKLSTVVTETREEEMATNGGRMEKLRAEGYEI